MGLTGAYRDKRSREENKRENGDTMHRIGLVFSLRRNVVHLDRPPLHGFGRVIGKAGVVLAHAHVAVLEYSLELRRHVSGYHHSRL